MPTDHIQFNRLADLAEGRLVPESAAELRVHLDACPRCAADMAWLQRVIGVMRSDDSADAPDWAVARVVRLSRTRRAEDAPAPSLAGRILAVLQFDSGTRRLAHGLRTGQAGPRQILYSAGAYDLDLRLAPAGAQWEVSGQVLGPETGGRVSLMGAAASVAANLNAEFEFSLQAVPTGSYRLVVDMGSAVVEVPDIQLGDG